MSERVVRSLRSIGAATAAKAAAETVTAAPASTAASASTGAATAAAGSGAATAAAGSGTAASSPAASELAHVTHTITLKGARLSWAILEGHKTIENRTIRLRPGW